MKSSGTIFVGIICLGRWCIEKVTLAQFSLTIVRVELFNQLMSYLIGCFQKLNQARFYRSSFICMYSYLTFCQVFDKALDEPKYSSMYARLCLRLCEEAPGAKDGNLSFKPLLLNSCKAVFDARTEPKTDKRKSLGNIKVCQKVNNISKDRIVYYYSYGQGPKAMHHCEKTIKVAYTFTTMSEPYVISSSDKVTSQSL